MSHAELDAGDVVVCGDRIRLLVFAIETADGVTEFGIFKVGVGNHRIKCRALGQVIFVTQRVFLDILGTVPVACMVDLHVVERCIDAAGSDGILQAEDPVVLGRFFQRFFATQFVALVVGFFLSNQCPYVYGETFAGPNL